MAIVTKEDATEGCTKYAQGGVSAVLAELDSVEDHVHDTLVAGDFLNIREAVEVVCKEGPAQVLALAELGATFTRSRNGSLHLTREGGHSTRRVVHAEDATGQEIERALMAMAGSHTNITFFEHHLAADLILDRVDGVQHCLGADILDQRRQKMTRFVAPVTMLATGGAGQVYPITTNPGVTTGDGMAMAARASANMGGMEFVQFHPTGFYSGKPAPSGRTFLISEAVRGEGGLLLNSSGHRFMEEYDSRLELAPRDIVARAIQDQMLRSEAPHVYLDISHCQREHVLTHFPNIAAQCLGQGIDITTAPIPVAPAAHFMCGGVKTGLGGETSVAGLFAAGEVAYTGLHGANRLASNSLLEGLVFANRAVAPSIAHADHALHRAGRQLHHASVHADSKGSKAVGGLRDSTREWVASKRSELQQVMWSNVGIQRRTKDMAAALQSLHLMGFESQATLQSYGKTTELIELHNLVTVGTQITEAALRRKDSRGGHYNLDFPRKEYSAKEASATKGSGLGSAKFRHVQQSLGQENDLLVRGASPSRVRPRSRDTVSRSQKRDQS